MFGHLPIIEMRKRGTKPVAIFINDFPDSTAKDWHEPGRKYSETWNPDFPKVCTQGVSIDGLDLRFVRGVTVHVMSERESRAKQLFAKAIDEGASIVGSCHQIPGSRPIDPSGWFAIYKNGEVTNG